MITKEDNEDFKNTTISWICKNDNVDKNVKVRDHCHIIGKYWVSANRDFNISHKFNHKTPIVFHNLKNYASHLITHELVKFNRKINILPNGLEMGFTINSKLSFIDSFQF